MKTFVFGVDAPIHFFELRLNTRYLTDKECDIV